LPWTGLRYIWQLTFEDAGVRFHAQDSRETSLSWDELHIDQ